MKFVGIKFVKFIGTGTQSYDMDPNPVPHSGSRSRDSKNVDPMRIWIGNPGRKGATVHTFHRSNAIGTAVPSSDSTSNLLMAQCDIKIKKL